MKKIMLLIAAMMIILSACNMVPASTTDATILTGDNGCGIYPSFYDLDEYNKFVTSTDLIRKDFIKWQDIAVLGIFDDFCLTSRDRYSYGISNGKGWGTTLYIDHDPENDPYRIPRENYPTTSIANDMTSMRMVSSDSEDNVIIIRNGVQYLYVPSGELLSITWYENGIEFTLSNGRSLYKYPDGETANVISKLLSVSDDVANAAMAEIRQNLNHETS